MGLGNQIKKNKAEAQPKTEPPKMIAVTMTELHWRILIGTLAMSQENVGKFGLDSAEVGTVHANCNTFINAIGSAINTEKDKNG